jgi:hypothetical protein
MHKEVETTRKAMISKNHQVEYTAYKPSVLNTSNQKGPNWFT